MEKNKPVSITLLCFSILGAYLLPFAKFSSYFIVIINLKSAVLMCLLTIACIYYIFFKFDGYNETMARLFLKDSLSEEIIRKKQIDLNSRSLNPVLTTPRNIQKLHGYHLLNALMITRYRKNITKYGIRRFFILFVLFVWAIFSICFHSSATINILRKLYLFIPILPIICCQLAYGEGFCKFCYQNCDHFLLAKHFFRTRKSLLTNFFIRCVFVSKVNFLLGICTSLLLTITYLISDVPLYHWVILMFAAVIILYLTFGIHHLAVYYLLQPYVRGNTFQNPSILFAQLPILVISIILTQFSNKSVLLIQILISICTLYAAVLILLVVLKCRSTFVLR